MAAITWRNVESKSNSEVSQGYAAATNGINAGLKGLVDTFGQYETGLKKDAEYADNTRVQGFMDRLQQAKSPEEMAALQASGELDQFRAGMTPDALAKVRGAGEARTSSLMQQATVGQTFQDQQTERDQRPQKDHLKSLIANKDYVGASAFLAEHPQLTGKAAYVTDIAAGKQSAEDRAQVLTSRADAVVDRAYLLKDRTRLDEERKDTKTLASEQRSRDELSRAKTALDQTNAQLASGDANVVGNPGGKKMLTSTIADAIKDPEASAIANEAINTALGKNPAFGRLPTEVVYGIVLSHANSFNDLFSTTSGWASTLEKELKAALEYHGPAIEARDKQYKSLVAQRDEQQKKFVTAEESADPALKALRAASASALKDELKLAQAGSTSKPTDKPVNSPSSVKNLDNALFAENVKLEQEEVQARTRKEFSPDVAKHLDGQQGKDRDMFNKVGSTVRGELRNFSAAYNDMVTAPVRGIGHGINNLLRVPNAYGADIPTIPDNGWLSTLRPYAAEASRKNSGEYYQQDLEARRENLEKRLKAASKK